MSEITAETLFKEFVVLKYNEGIKYTKIVELFNEKSYADLKEKYPQYITGFEWFIGKYQKDKMGKAIDNIYQKHKREISKPKAEMPPIVIQQDNKTIVLKPRHNPSSGTRNLSEDGNIIEVDINISSGAGRKLYKEIQSNATLRAEYRDFVHGLVQSKKDDIGIIFDNLLETVKTLSNVDKFSANILTSKVLKEAISNFTMFFNSMKSPDWITPFSSETLALGHTIASEIQGIQNGVMTKEVGQSSVDPEEKALLDLTQVKFSGIM
jgi:hypothetical protein